MNFVPASRVASILNSCKLVTYAARGEHAVWGKSTGKRTGGLREHVALFCKSEQRMHGKKHCDLSKLWRFVRQSSSVATVL